MSSATQRAVNRNGDIVGGSNSDAFLMHSGKMSNLGPGEALGIDDFGEIAGTLDGQPHNVDAAALAPVVADFFGEEMRRIISQLFVLLDGVMKAPEDWHFPYCDNRMAEVVAEQIDGADILLPGRATY